MPKLAIIHFSPLELYPPVMNFLHFVSERLEKDWDVRVFSTRSNQLKKEFPSPAPFVKIVRIGRMPQTSTFNRYLAYLRFFTGVSARLAAWRPDAVIYYETISSMPALLYKRIFRPPARLLVHYHEYMSKHEYRQGMALNRWFHRWEVKTYPRYAWISHTNDERLDCFLSDNRDITIPSTHVLPNYPPSAWIVRTPRQMQKPLRVIYAGALGFEAMYLAEFAKWVLAQKGKVIWDIYSVNITPEAKKFLEGLDRQLIRFKGNCDYYDLPGVLATADVGVVLYKGVTRNQVMLVPNKVSEYLACGLDVWYTAEMTGTDPLVTSGVYPKVLAIDCKNLDRFDLEKALDRTGLAFRPCPYFYEDVYGRLLEAVITP